MVILTEAKQVGVLYHVTDLEGFNGIIDSDTLGKYRDSYTSFTRDPRYTYVSGTEKFFIVQLVFDGNKLSTRYKITPFASQDPYVNGKRFEAEERIVGQIKDVGKYLLEVRPLRKNYNYSEQIHTMEYFKFLKKYPHIKNSLIPEELNPLNLVQAVEGIYKNGKRVKPFNSDNAATVCWKFFGLDKKYADDPWMEGSFFSGFEPSYSVDSTDAKGYDFVWVSYSPNHKGAGIIIRAQNPNKYTWLKKYGPLEFRPYVHPFEAAQGGYDERDD